MKRLFTVLLVISLPVLLFLTVWQSYRYSELSADVAELEQVQKEIFEKNKKIVMGIEFLKSPFRINKLAEEELELEKINPDRIFRIKLNRNGGQADG